MMQWIKPGTKIDFVGQMKIWVGVSLALMTISFISLVLKDLNYGIDFAGGTELLVKFEKPVSSADVRSVVVEQGFGKNVVQTVREGDRDYFLVRVESFSSLSGEQAKEIKSKLSAALGPEVLKRFRFGSETGDKIEIKLSRQAAPGEMAAVFAKIGVPDAQVRPDGKPGDNQYLVILTGIAKKIEKALAARFAGNAIGILRVEAVGPQVGKQLRTDGFLAIVYSIIAILIYVALRFDIRFSPGAVLSLVHDAVIIIGVFNVLNFEFDMTVLAAVLTLMGYSINDTIVVYDRIRENLPKYRNSTLSEVVNLSVNETLSRTLMTSFTVLLVAGSLLFIGGHSLFGFAFAMFFGIVTGTYSSVFIAAPVTIALENWYKRVRKA
ncbi:MAG: protein translocase subunit SecF [Deltaproteobacteria bacterium]|nr:protein translocase subunit SecF [Deltaproteobacteria bacterium]